MYSYAIIGFGGLGRTHVANLDKISKIRGDIYLKAVCGTTAEEFSKSVSINIGTTETSGIDISGCRFYDDYKELILKEKPDIVISALPTFLHREVAVVALEHGCHVFSEKPMAITPEECKMMTDAAEKNGKKLFIGHCLRFSPAYVTLKEYIESEKWGKPRRAEFARYSCTPYWTFNNWILDPDRSGGCVLDMHVHDVDIVNWYFGAPDSIDSVITENKVKSESVFGRYYYDDGLFVTADADWSLSSEFPFRSRCMVFFDNAVAEICGDVLTVYTEDEIIVPELSKKSYFETEMECFLKYVIDDVECDNMSFESVCETMNFVFREKDCARVIKKSL